ncbi:flagellar motor protein MotB [Lachnospiraceae bacterium 62-35]
MSRRKKIAGDGDCGSWMDTYGDMVTLLLCFFVMLYSMSSLNQQKWEIFVKSIYPNADDKEQIAINEKLADGEFDVTGNLQIENEIDAEKDELYIALLKKLNDNGIEGVSVSRGEGYTFVVFENQAFFNGDSSILTNEATKVLDVFCEAIEPEADKISQIEIMGHTAQAGPDRPNNPRTDRLLSALRSAEVAAYIQSKDIIEPDKLVGISYGQFRPVDSNDTQEGRAKNRRVEFLIVDAGADIKSMNDYYDEYYSNIDEGSVVVTDGVSGESGEGFAPIEGGSMEGEASMVPTSAPESPEPIINPPD